jgi:hypothetical protein
MANLQHAPFLKSLKYKEQQVRAPREGARKEIVEFALGLIEEASRFGIPLFAHEYLRDEQRQNMLHQKGFSKARYGESAHNFGLAVDIIHGIQGWELDRVEWSIIGGIGSEVARKKKLSIQWGGEWSFYDPAHWELKNWREMI